MASRLGITPLMHRQKTYFQKGQAPVRECQCAHPSWLHKEWKGKCVDPECPCKSYRQVGRNKYMAKKSVLNGQVYDSKFERDYAFELDLLQRSGEITEVKRQVDFPLYVNGKKITTYRADFVVTFHDGRKEIIETKGFKTDSFRIKWNLLDAIMSVEHPEIGLRLVMLGGKRRVY